uniref:FERM domain-containing protein n=1 Tax=Panagrolaimus sp. JU765 TaxID=591449 RepID=A0AC34QBA5_9BILA
MNHKDFRKLSESRQIKLPIIPMKPLFGPNRSLSAAPRIESTFSKDEYSPITQVMNDFSLADISQRTLSSQSFNPIINDPTETTTTPTEFLDIRIFLPDGKSIQFTIENGKEAQTTDLLSLIAEHYEIPEEIIKDCFSLWLVSPLFEVQLKSYHCPAQIRMKWQGFLQKFTDANDDDIAIDEPLLVMKRNVTLTIDAEKMYEKDYEKIVEILYLDAKDQYMLGRYLVDVPTALELAALQIAIDYEPYEDGHDDEAFELVHTKLSEFVSPQHLSKIRTFQLFGLSIMECKHGLETEVVQLYKDFSLNFGSKNERRIAYLDLLRLTPFYGAAFFDGQTERRSTFFDGQTEKRSNLSIFDYGKRFLTGLSPKLKMNVRIGIQHDFITIVDISKLEILLTQRIGDCSWHNFGIGEEDESLFLHFPDPTILEDGKQQFDDTNDIPPSKILQIFSHQSMLMIALLNSLDDMAANDIGSANDLAIHPIINDNNGQIYSYSSSMSDNGHIIDGNVGISSQSSKASSSIPSYGKTTNKTSSLSRLTMKTGIDSMNNNNKLSKLCLASLDLQGCCVEAHGSLKKIFIPVH